jgi:hypothetical protein
MRITSICASFVLSIAGIANAQTIYATNNLAGGGGAGTQNTLISFNAANPAGWATVGSMGVAGIGFGGLDFNGAGSLYAYASYLQAGGSASGLYSVNVLNGAATLVGNSGQTLQDLAWNPATNTMYGVNSATNVASLYSINLGNGATTLVGNFVGLAATNLEVGLAVDSQGNYYVHDIASDRIYKSTAPGSLTVAQMPYVLGDTNFSQGMTINWSGNGGPVNKGFHGAIGSAPSFFSELRTFDAVPGTYTTVGNFGTPSGTFPTVETGDLAIQPIPEPAAALMLVLGGLMLRRRR